MNIINGPVNNLKRVFKRSHTKQELQESVKYFLDSFDLDLDADGNKARKPSWHSDDDAVIRLLYGRMHDGVIADELGCTIHDLRVRAHQKGKFALLEEFDEDAIQMVKNLHNKGASDSGISIIMGIDTPLAPYSQTNEQKQKCKKVIAKYTKQTDAFKE